MFIVVQSLGQATEEACVHMRKIILNGTWEMRPKGDSHWLDAAVPGSVYQDLINAGLLQDPYWRDNEKQANEIIRKDFQYRRRFHLTDQDLQHSHLALCFDGIDTLCQVYLNGKRIGVCNNMHRIWRFDIREHAESGYNEVLLDFASPIEYVYSQYERQRIMGANECTKGYPYLRKAHYMFGWDWGARLPDAGIFRDVYIEVADIACIRTVNVKQAHESSKVILDIVPNIEWFRKLSESFQLAIRVTSPDGKKYLSSGNPIEIEQPQLWFPNGYGLQPLYTVDISLAIERQTVDEWHGQIGLRQVQLVQQDDQWGKSFYFRINDIPVFAMGADYIPEDHILARRSPERTCQLLEDCVRAHFNMIRVWGGGYYPDDTFYETCDKLGLMVWQDFMFACSCYDLSPEFTTNVQAEILDNARRIGVHPCVVLWCGNNEIEMCLYNKRWDVSDQVKENQKRLFQEIIPETLKEALDDAIYWPSSPSSNDNSINPNDEHIGDAHYWDVWHGGDPFTAYRDHYFRFVSEFGFQSFPCFSTIKKYTLDSDRNMFSYVMDKHQRNNQANGIIMRYLSNTYLNPPDFEMQVYASQLLAAEAIKYGVEHWRRNRGRCMGTLFWQLNDCWPVCSWSSIDYYGNWKALHYAAARFYQPILLSCEETNTMSLPGGVNAEDYSIIPSIKLNISNETVEGVTVDVSWELRNADSVILESGKIRVTVAALTSKYLPSLRFPKADIRKNYVSYSLKKDGDTISEGTALFTEPKYFMFEDPHLEVIPSDGHLTIQSQAFARGVQIVCEDDDCLFSDNYFDMEAGRKEITIIRGSGKRFSAHSIYDFGVAKDSFL